MPPINANLWTAEQDTILREAHKDGHSFTQMAAMVGRTRNACIGRAHRLHLQFRITDETREAWAKKREESKRKAGRDRRSAWYRFNELPPKRLPEPPAAPIEFAFLNIPLIDLQPHHCRFPRGEGPFLFCGQPKQFPEISSYCAHHNRICFDRGRTVEGRMRAREREIQFQQQKLRIVV